MITKQDLLGEWELENFEIMKSDFDKKPWGKKMHGILIYTAGGYMSVSINSVIAEPKNDRKKLKSMLFYAGMYQIKDNKVVHYVMNASDDNRIGQALVREANIEKGEMTLTGIGEFGTAKLRWKKLCV